MRRQNGRRSCRGRRPGAALARLPRARATYPGRSAHRNCYSATALWPGMCSRIRRVRGVCVVFVLRGHRPGADSSSAGPGAGPAKPVCRSCGRAQRLLPLVPRCQARARRAASIAALTTTVIPSASSRPSRGWLEVTGTGPGIPADELPRIFDRFWRGRGAGHVSGSGIGLAVAAELARAHGGRLDAHSEPGHGARLTLTLPRA